MSNKATAEKVYKYIELKQFDKLATFIRGKDLTAISLVSVVDLLINQHNYPLEVLEAQGAIVDIEDLLLSARAHLQGIKTNPGLKGALKNLKHGLEQLIESWKKGSLHNEAAEQFLNSQAIRLMQTSWQHGAKEVDDYVTENSKTQLKSIYSQWLANANAEQEVMKQIDEMIESYLFANWKKDLTFDAAIQQKLTKNANKLLLNDYQSGQLPLTMTETIENAVIDMFLGLVRNETLGQYPKLETYFSSTVAILLKGSKPFDMTPAYTQSFQKIMLDCKSGALGGEIPVIIKQFALEAIEAAKFSHELVKAFEKRAVQELILELKQQVTEVPEALQTLVESTVIDYLENKYRNDKEFGAAITTQVINLLLVEWKAMESPELKKAVESIVMQPCNALLQDIDKVISSAVLAQKVVVLEEKNTLQEKIINQLLVTLAHYGMTIQTTLNDAEEVVNSTTPTPQGETAAMIGLFGNRGLQAARQEEILTFTTDSPR